jgi:hypothetical protein
MSLHGMAMGDGTTTMAPGARHENFGETSARAENATYLWSVNVYYSVEAGADGVLCQSSQV